MTIPRRGGNVVAIGEVQPVAQGGSTVGCLGTWWWWRCIIITHTHQQLCRFSIGGSHTPSPDRVLCKDERGDCLVCLCSPSGAGLPSRCRTPVVYGESPFFQTVHASACFLDANAQTPSLFACYAIIDTLVKIFFRSM